MGPVGIVIALLIVIAFVAFWVDVVITVLREEGDS